MFFDLFFNDDRLSLKSLFVTFIGSFFRLSVSPPLPLPASKIIFFWSLKKNIFNPKFIFKMSPNTMDGPAPSHGRRSWRRAWPALACCMFNTKLNRQQIVRLFSIEQFTSGTQDHVSDPSGHFCGGKNWLLEVNCHLYSLPLTHSHTHIFDTR